MKLRIWHILAIWGVVLLVGTIGAADMGAISTARIVLQVVMSFVLIIGSYVSFIVRCNKHYKKRWDEYEKR